MCDVSHVIIAFFSYCLRKSKSPLIKEGIFAYGSISLS